jgi:hypothetical protein
MAEVIVLLSYMIALRELVSRTSLPVCTGIREISVVLAIEKLEVTVRPILENSNLPMEER